MRRNTDRIQTTHAGSLPRPDDLTRLMWDSIDGKAVDAATLKRRVAEAVCDVVSLQRTAGIDVISDGEMSKIGFSNYVIQRFSGFGERAQFLATDLADFPILIQKMFIEDEGGKHLVMPVVDGPIELQDREAVKSDIANFKSALGNSSPDDAFIPKPSRQARCYSTFLITIIRPVRSIWRPRATPCELNIRQLSMRASICSWILLIWRCIATASVTARGRRYAKELYSTGDRSRRSIMRRVVFPAEKMRLHLCWGNYAGPHHHDVEMRDIIEPVLKANASFIYFEAANPRHEHEWEVWNEVKLPDDKAIIPGVIDTVTNTVEHPRLVAQRLERFAKIVGRENVIGGDGLRVWYLRRDSTIVIQRSPGSKLEALAQGARMASEELW